jgi:hypothetical protein
LSKVGAITKKVKKSEKPIITGLGGICWVPNAPLNKERTTTILVKDVTIISILGARVIMVSMKSISKVEAISLGFFALSTDIVNLGIG